MTTRQTLPELLARISEDLTEARLNAASRAVREERARADRYRDEAVAYREILDDVRESLELLVPVPVAHSACHPEPESIPVAELAEVLGCGADAASVWSQIQQSKFAAIITTDDLPPDDAQVADPDGWYSHQGQMMPWCFISERIEVRFRDGSRWSGLAGNVTWGHMSMPKDIVLWRPESAPVGTDGVSTPDALGWHRRYYTGIAGYPTGIAKVEYQRRSGMLGRKQAGLLDWTVTGGHNDIVRWRHIDACAASEGES